ncbi:hypothetical protein GAGA_1582 [Paraglaciecola agarilytica NO2]|uniref:Uncharacterized protein n=1 Tax=Paraglaciecola agarilytica NO2 TaxID=1125747 RepID=A0ABQ0I549_9ALTE|nr:hypothetical protein GAGA_1582 [Paraglaciecola agarilytica NO2]
MIISAAEPEGLNRNLNVLFELTSARNNMQGKFISNAVYVCKDSKIKASLKSRI